MNHLMVTYIASGVAALAIGWWSYEDHGFMHSLTITWVLLHLIEIRYLLRRQEPGK